MTTTLPSDISDQDADLMLSDLDQYISTLDASPEVLDAMSEDEFQSALKHKRDLIDSYKAKLVNDYNTGRQANGHVDKKLSAAGIAKDILIDAPIAGARNAFVELDQSLESLYGFLDSKTWTGYRIREIANLESEPLRAAYEKAGLQTTRFGDIAILNARQSKKFHDVLASDGLKAKDSLSLEAFAQATKLSEVETDTAIGGLVEGTTQFGIGWLSGGRYLTPFKGGRAATSANFVAGGAAVDAAYFDPFEANFFDFANSIPGVKAVVPDFLNADEDDAEIEGRLKNALAGVVAGAAIDGVLNAAKIIRSHRKKSKIEQEVKQQLDSDESFQLTKEDDGPPKPDEEAPKADLKDTPKESEGSPQASPESLEGPAKPNAPQRFRLSDKDAIQLAKDLENFEPTGSLVPQARINLEKYDLGDVTDEAGFDMMIEAVTDAIAKANPKGLSEEITHKAQKDLAEQLDMSFQEAGTFAQSITSQNAPLSAKMLGMRTLLASQGDLVSKLHVRASKSGLDSDKVALAEQLQRLHALSSYVSRSSSELGRALNSLKLTVEARKTGEDVLERVLNDFGGSHIFEGVMRQVGDAKNLRELNSVIRMTPYQRTIGMINEVVVNGLLTALKTPAMNILSGKVQLGLQVMDRSFGYGIGKLKSPFSNAERIRFNELSAFSRAYIESYPHAVINAAKTFQENTPQLDAKARFEGGQRSAFNFDPKETDGPIVASVKKFSTEKIAPTINVASRINMTGDEMIKTIAYSMRAQELATRHANKLADKAGKIGTARVKFVERESEKWVKGLLPSRKQKIVEEIRKTTFQERVGKGTDSFRELVEWIPAGRAFIAPYINTPSNILSQSFVDSTPLGLAKAEHRKIFAKGGPERDILLGRYMTVGAIITATLSVMDTDIITGKMDYQSTESLDGKQPYSILIGGKWYDYSKLDPVGTWLGTVANIKEVWDSHKGTASEETLVQSLIDYTGGMVSVGLDKSWLQSIDGMFDVLNALSNADADPDKATSELNKYAADQATKLIPFSSALRSINYTGKDFKEEAFTISDKIDRAMPGGRPLPPKRDILGRPIANHNSAFTIINSNPESLDPLNIELARLDINVRNIPKKIDGLTLTVEQYNRIGEIIQEEKIFNGQTLEEALSNLLESRQYSLLTNSAPSDIVNNKRVVGGKETVVKDMISAARSYAKQKLLQEDEELRNSVLNVKFEEARQLIGQ